MNLRRRLQRLENQVFGSTDRDAPEGMLSAEDSVRGLRSLLASSEVSDPFPHLEGGVYLDHFRAWWTEHSPFADGSFRE
jgi:hypothetical protein